MPESRRPAARSAGIASRRWCSPKVRAVTGCALFISAVAGWLYWKTLIQQPTTFADVVAPGAAADFNVLIVTLDTVRRDRLGCYGDAQAETPTCDRLAREGVLFDDAVTSVPLTLPSHTTLFTGLYPLHHGVRDNGTHRLENDRPTMAEAFKMRGYDTAAFVGCFVLDARFGLDQGFDVYDFQVSPNGYRPQQLEFNERPANEVTDAAIGWLEQRQAGESHAPFFMWVHYFDAHLPYTSPLMNQARFADRGYDAEIAFADQNLGRLRGELERLDLWRRTLVVVTADHGESLGEHQEPTHGMLLYEGAVRVPLIVCCPALFKGPVRIADQVVGLADVTPTLLNLCGLPPVAPCDGADLLRTGPDTARAIYLETLTPLRLAGWSPLYAMRTYDAKYILAPTPEYYDLHEDRQESRNLATANPPRLPLLGQQLHQMEIDSTESTVANRAISDEEVQRLAALGYVETPAPRSQGPRADPKDMMDVFLKAQACEELYQRAQYEQAAASAQEVLEQCPQCIQAQRVLAFSYIRLGQPREAVALLRSAVRDRPDVFLVRSLAQALIIAGELDQAWETLDLYAALDPTDGQVELLRGDIRVRQQRMSEAVAHYEAAIRQDENRVGITARERIERLGSR